MKKIRNKETKKKKIKTERSTYVIREYNKILIIKLQKQPAFSKITQPLKKIETQNPPPKNYIRVETYERLHIKNNVGMQKLS